MYRGKLVEAEDNMNSQMANVTVTFRYSNFNFCLICEVAPFLLSILTLQSVIGERTSPQWCGAMSIYDWLRKFVCLPKLITLTTSIWKLLFFPVLRSCGAGAGGAEIILGPGAGAENKF